MQWSGVPTMPKRSMKSGLIDLSTRQLALGTAETGMPGHVISGPQHLEARLVDVALRPGGMAEHHLKAAEAGDQVERLLGNRGRVAMAQQDDVHAVADAVIAERCAPGIAEVVSIAHRTRSASRRH